jgi:hypothetical protein
MSEDLLDEIEAEEIDEKAETIPEIEEELSSNVTRQLIMSYLERRSIELGATERIENFCADYVQKNGKVGFLKLRQEVLKSFELLTPRPLRLEILQMATEFVDKFMPLEEHTDDQSTQIATSSSNEPFLSDNSTSSSV